MWCGAVLESVSQMLAAGRRISAASARWRPAGRAAARPARATRAYLHQARLEWRCCRSVKGWQIRLSERLSGCRYALVARARSASTAGRRGGSEAVSIPGRDDDPESNGDRRASGLRASRPALALSSGASPGQQERISGSRLSHTASYARYAALAAYRAAV